MTPNDLDPLSPELQALLDAERPLTAAPAAAKSRLLARLSTELFDGPGGDGGGSDGNDGGASGDGGATPSTDSTGASHAGSATGSGTTAASSVGSTATTAATGAATAGSGLIAKAVVAKLVVGASVASLAVGGAIGAGVHSVVTEPVKPVVPVQPLPVVVAPVVEAIPEPPPPPLVHAEAAPAVTPVAPPAPPKEPRLTADEQLALEKSFVEQARVAMARQDVNGALDALAQHHRRFPNGQLTEERMALEVMALSSAGRSIEARNAANAFRKRFPTGLFRAAVDATSPE